MNVDSRSGLLRHRTVEYGFLLAIALGVALRLACLDDPKLWSDEIFSVALAESPFIDLLVLTVRHDVHPPLYYAQLHIWSYFGHSDLWYIVNSMLWNVAGLVLVGVLAARRYGRLTGLAAAAVYAVMPINMFYAENVRMYSMLACFLIVAFFSLETMLDGPERPARARAAYLLSSAAAVLSHGIGFLVVGFLFLRGAAGFFRQGGTGAALRFALLNGPLGLLALYPLVIGSMRGTVGLETFDAGLLGINLTIAMLGFNVPFPAVAGVLAAAVLVVPCLFVERSRPVVLWLFVLPLMVFLTVSLTVKPIFNHRTIGIFTLFLAIGLAIWLGLAARPGQLARPLMALALLPLPLLMGFSVNQAMRYEKEDYRAVTAFWVAEALPDDDMFVDDSTIVFWGFVRYTQGAGLASGLAVQPPVPDKWQRIFALIGEPLAKRLKLVGAEPFLRRQDQRIFPNAPTADQVRSDRYWVFGRRGRTERPCVLDGYTAVSGRNNHNFEIALCERTGDR